MREATKEEYIENVKSDIKDILNRYYNVPPNKLVEELYSYIEFITEDNDVDNATDTSKETRSSS